MKKKVIEKVMSVESYLDDIVSENISDNQDVQRNFCSSNAFVDGIIMTILTDDYLPSLILGEIAKDGIVEQYLVDGMQRTGALRKFRFEGYKIGKGAEETIVEYQRKKKDENGVIVRDDEGLPEWETAEFDMKKKGYDDLPPELKKRFNNFQAKVAIHQGCQSMRDISKLVRKYNINTAMNANQKSFTYLDLYARKVKTIAASDFFNESAALNDKQNAKGLWENMVIRSVMTVFHLDSYKKAAKDIAVFLNTNASDVEFEQFQHLANSLSDVVGDAYKDLFVPKNIPVWFAAYNHFTESGIENIKFRKFLDAFKENLHMNSVELDCEVKNVDGDVTWDKLDALSGTTDNGVVKAKIKALCQLIDEFFGIEKMEKTEAVPTVEENNTVAEINESDDLSNEDAEILKFAQENVRSDIDRDDISVYDLYLLKWMNDDSNIYKAGKDVVFALMAYATDKGEDKEFKVWLDKENAKNNTYSSSHKTNFTYLKRDFDEFLEKGNGGKAA